jgi:glycosyl hydrolase family 16
VSEGIEARERQRRGDPSFLTEQTVAHRSSPPPRKRRFPARLRLAAALIGWLAVQFILFGGALYLKRSPVTPPAHEAAVATQPAPTDPSSPMTPVVDAPGSACPGSSSGNRMPVGDIRGWRQVFSDDFEGSGLDTAKWTAYSGQPGGDKAGWWAPSHVVVGDCGLTLKSYRDPAARAGVFVSGGIGMHLRQTFGKYLVRMRVDHGDGISAIALLWPAQDLWPPEVDFYEDGGGARNETSATLHCGQDHHDDCTVQRSLSGYDFSRWHTVGVEWTSGKLVYTIDGTAWATITGSDVPSIPMWLAIQTQSLECSEYATCVTASTPPEVDMQVAWVVAYAPA